MSFNYFRMRRRWSVGCLALSGLVSFAQPALALYKGSLADVWLEITAYGQYDSNFYGRGESDADNNPPPPPDPNVPQLPDMVVTPAEASEWSFNAQPMLHVARTKGLIQAQGSVGVLVRRFKEFPHEDTEELKSYLRISGMHGPERPLSFSLTGSFVEQSESNTEVATRIQEEVLNLGAEASYRVSKKFSVGGAGFYTDNKVETLGFVGNETVGWGTTVQYHYSEKLSFLVGYRNRDTEVDELSDEVMQNELYRLYYMRVDPVTGLLVPINDEDVSSTDDSFFVGATGQFLSKLQGTIRVGIQERKYKTDIRPDQSALMIDLGLDWRATNKTTVSFSATRDYATTVAAETELRTVFGIFAEHQLREKILLSGGVEYQDSRFTRPGDDQLENSETRSDDVMVFHLGGQYKLSSQTSLFAEAVFSNRNSGLQSTDYSRFVASLGVVQLF